MTEQMLSWRMAKYGKELSGIQRKIKEIEKDETANREELEKYKDKESECWLKLVELKERKKRNNQQIAKCDEEIQELQQLVPLEEITVTKGEQVESSDGEERDMIASISDAEDESSSEDGDAPSKPECINNEEKPQQVSDNIETEAIDGPELIKNYESEIEWIEFRVQEYQTEIHERQTQIRKLEQRKAECQQGIKKASEATGHGSAPTEEASIGASVGLQQISADDKKFTELERNIQQPVSPLRAAQARRSDRKQAQHTPESAQSWSSPTKGATSMPAMHKGEGASVGLQHISGTEKKRENPEHNFKKDLKGIPAARHDAEEEEEEDSS